MIDLESKLNEKQPDTDVKQLDVKYTVKELLEGINEENLHGEIYFGEDVGREIVDYGI